MNAESSPETAKHKTPARPAGAIEYRNKPGYAKVGIISFFIVHGIAILFLLPILEDIDLRVVLAFAVCAFIAWRYIAGTVRRMFFIEKVVVPSANGADGGKDG